MRWQAHVYGNIFLRNLYVSFNSSCTDWSNLDCGGGVRGVPTVHLGESATSILRCSGSTCATRGQLTSLALGTELANGTAATAYGRLFGPPHFIARNKHRVCSAGRYNVLHPHKSSCVRVSVACGQRWVGCDRPATSGVCGLDTITIEVLGGFGVVTVSTVTREDGWSATMVC